MVSLKDKWKIALAVEEEVVLKEAYVAGAGVSIEMPTEKKRTCCRLQRRKTIYYGSPSRRRLYCRNALRSSVFLTLSASRS